MNTQTREESHYYAHLASARANGFKEPISLTENWQGRVDALYAEINAMAGTASVGNVVCWPGNPGMLADGRMACLVETYDFVEFRRVTLFALIEAP
jgi:hypothetical protein